MYIRLNEKKYCYLYSCELNESIEQNNETDIAKNKNKFKTISGILNTDNKTI